jgi:von Willebrand factor type A domain
MKRGTIAAVTGSLVLALVACGSDGNSEFGDGSGANDPGNGVPSGASLPEIGPKGTGSACVSQVAGAELTPTNLVFMYDKSGSMGDPANGFDPAQRWVPVGSGMKQFFADSYSATLRASLQFFPQNDIDVSTACAYSYATPKVALTMASDPAFVGALDTTKPQGGTPTLPALQGAISYAKDLLAQRPEDKTAVVLVTDGEPGFYDATAKAFVPGCPNNTVENVAAAAKAAYDTSKISTYVIGVGPSLTKLNAIAQAGGTGSAIMVDVNDPTKTKQQIVDALNAIRRQVVACDFTLPPPPAGEELDPLAVNVVLSQADGSEKVLAYSKTCDSAEGWRYDDPAAPKRVTLCASACDTARASTAGKVSIAFGCKTRVAVQ